MRSAGDPFGRTVAESREGFAGEKSGRITVDGTWAFCSLISLPFGEQFSSEYLCLMKAYQTYSLAVHVIAIMKCLHASSTTQGESRRIEDISLRQFNW